MIKCLLDSKGSEAQKLLLLKQLITELGFEPRQSVFRGIISIPQTITQAHLINFLPSSTPSLGFASCTLYSHVTRLWVAWFGSVLALTVLILVSEKYMAEGRRMFLIQLLCSELLGTGLFVNCD